MQQDMDYGMAPENMDSTGASGDPEGGVHYAVISGVGGDKVEITGKVAVGLESAPLQSSSQKPEEGLWRRAPIVINWTDKNRLLLEINRQNTVARFSMVPPPSGQPETFHSGLFREVLEKCRVSYGLVQEVIDGFFEDVPNSLPYNRPTVIAIGEEAVNGVDGIVRELFPRELKPQPEERDDGSVDFKKLHIVNSVTKGTVICEITQPIAGIPGTTISGTTIRPVPPKMPTIPRGENVELLDINERQSQLIASTDGHLVYRNQRFNVDAVFTVKGNVDISTGNIDFMGNVVINGDVREGFKIRSDHDVTVHGIVEGAHIVAGGNILLVRGMNGMNKGVLECKGNIAAKFLENCTVRATGDIKAEEVINCTLETDGSIYMEGRGKLVGGRITAFGSVSAKTIGSRTNTPIHITLGVTPNMLNKRKQLKDQYKAVCAELEQLTHNIIFLEQPKYNNSLEHQRLLEDFRGKKNLVTFKKKRLESKVLQMDAEVEAPPTSTLTCHTVDPPFRITIGSQSLVLYDSANMCRFYLSEAGEITLGAL